MLTVDMYEDSKTVVRCPVGVKDGFKVGAAGGGEAGVLLDIGL